MTLLVFPWQGGKEFICLNQFWIELPSLILHLQHQAPVFYYSLSLFLICGFCCGRRKILPHHSVSSTDEISHISPLLLKAKNYWVPLIRILSAGVNGLSSVGDFLPLSNFRLNSSKISVQSRIKKGFPSNFILWHSWG